MDRIIRLFQAVGVIALTVAIGYSWASVMPAQAQDVLFDPDYYHADLRKDYQGKSCSRSGCWSQHQFCCVDEVSSGGN